MVLLFGVWNDCAQVGYTFPFHRNESPPRIFCDVNLFFFVSCYFPCTPLDIMFGRTIPFKSDPDSGHRSDTHRTETDQFFIIDNDHTPSLSQSVYLCVNCHLSGLFLILFFFLKVLFYFAKKKNKTKLFCYKIPTGERLFL